MQIDAVKFMRWPYLWEKAGGAGSPEKIYCDFLFNSSWHGYGSVSKHVIILMLVMPNTIYNPCQSNWFGQNNNPLTCYTYTVVEYEVCLQSTAQIWAICVLLECFQFMTPHIFTPLHSSDSWCYSPVYDYFFYTQNTHCDINPTIHKNSSVFRCNIYEL